MPNSHEVIIGRDYEDGPEIVRIVDTFVFSDPEELRHKHNIMVHYEGDQTVVQQYRVGPESIGQPMYDGHVLAKFVANILTETGRQAIIHQDVS